MRVCVIGVFLWVKLESQNQLAQNFYCVNAHTFINQLCSDFLVSKESAGAIEEEDFIKAFTDVPPVQVHYTVDHKCRNHMHSSHSVNKVYKLSSSGFLRLFCLHPPFSPMQIYSSRDLEDNLNKIREICSDDKHDWDQRAIAVSRFTFNFMQWNSFFLALLCVVIVAVCNLFFPPSQLKKIRSLLLAGAPTYDCFYQHLRLLDGAFKLSAKDLRSQVVREACFTVAWVLITDTADTGEYICINKTLQGKLHFVVLSHTCFRSCWILNSWSNQENLRSSNSMLTDSSAHGH